MLGGGTWVTQNKILPGAYINFVNVSRARANLGSRGVVAIAYPLTKTETSGKVITITSAEFVQQAKEKLGAESTDASMAVFRELFKHATKLYVFNMSAQEEGATPSAADALTAFESYDFNIIACYSDTKEIITTYMTQVKAWRDTIGKKCQLITYNAEDSDYEGTINVINTVSDSGADKHALVAWVAGAQAGCEVNASCTNLIYDGEYTVETPHSQTELETQLKAGNFVFHLVYEKVRVLEDINTLATVNADKGEDFKSNQTIRVCDQIANDIAYLFNTKYLGKIPNDAAGRTSFWGDIVAHHKALEKIRAIETFNPDLLTVEQGDTKKSVVVNDAITPTNAMAQLYMTVVVM